MKVTDTYEATWYLIKGAKLVGVRFSRLKAKKTASKGFREEWQLELENVPEKAIEDWRSGRAQCPLREFARRRMKLKRMINKIK